MVRDNVRDKLDYAFEDLGEQQVKNIARPIRVFALRLDGAAGVPEANASSAISTSLPVAAAVRDHRHSVSKNITKSSMSVCDDPVGKHQGCGAAGRPPMRDAFRRSLGLSPNSRIPYSRRIFW